MRKHPEPPRRYTEQEIQDAKVTAFNVNRTHRRPHELREWVEYPWGGRAYFGPPRQPGDQPTLWEAKCKRCGRTVSIRGGENGDLGVGGEALSQNCTTTK
ncbi:hypothetical protein [Sorangium sp. So ce1153]|uniref:hypothetical protein n=1 Tax=Sorangium sp. So ce1153 TaxID=3133333 RepID=UPI003F5F35D1